MVPRSSAPDRGALRPFTALVLALAPGLLLLARCGIWPTFPDDMAQHDGSVDGSTDGGHPDAAGHDVVSDMGTVDSGPFRTCPAPTSSQFALNMFAAPAGMGVPRDLVFDGHGSLFVGTELGLNVFASDGSLTAMPRMGVANIQAMRFNPLANELLAATAPSSGMTTGGVSAVDPTTGAVTRAVTSGLSNPGGIAVRADGTVFVSDTAGSIIRINPDGHAAVLTIQISSPTGLALTPDGLKLFAGSSSAGRGIFELDLDASGALVSMPTTYVSTFLTADGLAFDSCGYLYVSDRDGTRIVRVPPGGGTFDSIVMGTPPPMFSPRGIAFGTGGTFTNSDLFIADDSGAIYAMHIGVPGAALPHP